MSRFLREIQQQPEALRVLVEHYRSADRAGLHAVRDLLATSGRSLLFTGMGSSYYAPMSVQARLAAAGMGAGVAEAGELLHYELSAWDAETVVVAISQSGESAETRQVVQARAGRSPLVSVTNTLSSTLGRRGDVVLPLYAGAEAAISTKTYSNTLALLQLLATVITAGDLEAELVQLEAVVAGMEELLARRQQEMAAAAAFLEGVPFLYFVARGPSLTAAYQGALTFNEGARLPTCALAGGSFRHGPLELVDEDFAAVLLAPEGPTRELVCGLGEEVVAGGGRVLLLTDGPAPDWGSRGLVLRVDPGSESLFALRVCVALELLLHHVARQRGVQAGVFQRIGKVTRRE